MAMHKLLIGNSGDLHSFFCMRSKFYTGSKLLQDENFDFFSKYSQFFLKENTYKIFQKLFQKSIFETLSKNFVHKEFKLFEKFVKIFFFKIEYFHRIPLNFSILPLFYLRRKFYQTLFQIYSMKFFINLLRNIIVRNGELSITIAYFKIRFFKELCLNSEKRKPFKKFEVLPLFNRINYAKKNQKLKFIFFKILNFLGLYSFPKKENSIITQLMENGLILNIIDGKISQGVFFFMEPLERNFSFVLNLDNYFQIFDSILFLLKHREDTGGKTKEQVFKKKKTISREKITINGIFFRSEIDFSHLGNIFFKVYYTKKINSWKINFFKIYPCDSKFFRLVNYLQSKKVSPKRFWNSEKDEFLTRLIMCNLFCLKISGILDSTRYFNTKRFINKDGLSLSEKKLFYFPKKLILDKKIIKNFTKKMPFSFRISICNNFSATRSSFQKASVSTHPSVLDNKSSDWDFLKKNKNFKIKQFFQICVFFSKLYLSYSDFNTLTVGALTSIFFFDLLSNLKNCFFKPRTFNKFFQRKIGKNIKSNFFVENRLYNENKYRKNKFESYFSDLLPKKGNFFYNKTRIIKIFPTNLQSITPSIFQIKKIIFKNFHVFQLKQVSKSCILQQLKIFSKDIIHLRNINFIFKDNITLGSFTPKYFQTKKQMEILVLGNKKILKDFVVSTLR